MAGGAGSVPAIEAGGNIPVSLYKKGQWQREMFPSRKERVVKTRNIVELENYPDRANVSIIWKRTGRRAAGAVFSR